MRRWAIILIGLTWVLQWFNTPEQLVAFLNQLPEPRQLEAKLLVDAHGRSRTYGLLYRVETGDARPPRP